MPKHASEQSVTDLGLVVGSNTRLALNNAQAIANLGTAQCQIHNDDTTVITTTPQVLSFATDVGSTDTSIFEVDAATDTIIFKKNASYNFTSTVNFLSATNSTRTITFNLVNTADNSIIVSEIAIMNTHSGDTEVASLITLLTIGKGIFPVAPCTIRIEAVATGTGYSIPVFHSILASSSSYDVSSDAIGIAFEPVGSIEAGNVQEAIAELDARVLTYKSFAYTVIETSIDFLVFNYNVIGLTPDYLQVFIDGIQLAPTLDYTTVSTNRVNFTESKMQGAYIRVIGFA